MGFVHLSPSGDRVLTQIGLVTRSQAVARIADLTALTVGYLVIIAIVAE